MAGPVEDEDEATGRFADPGDTDEEEDEDEEDDEETTSEASQDQFQAYEGRLRTTMAKNLKTYTDKLNSSIKERVEARRQALETRVQQKLDEWIMAHVGAGQVQNPDIVAESLVRQAQAAEQRIAAVREQLAQLEQAGVDVSSIREKLSSAA